ncbi:DUF6114 domain-containing protein [Streptomyces sp. RB6PN25]|uniref:DUF6114 domain-containing protein n=1 Tax=Streptomyces humicola TaxID=2953240 RepID=A0ABT1PRZ8_9ACTN|nr:DUF6114 domain-containing protein [Streptomyces humicola]MCQ4080447.1 DUF6114 domain-containing protein [Streptomyces humicola]
MSAKPHGLLDRIGSWRRSFRSWRDQRPFWAGLLTLLGGLPIMYLPYANLTLGQLTIRMATTAGSGSLIIGVLLVVLGITMWFQSAARFFAGVAAILLALVSLVVSNFGGFLVGFLLALIGGGLSIAWAPGTTAPDAAGEGATPPGPAGDGGGGHERTPEPAWSAFGDDKSLNGRHRA